MYFEIKVNICYLSVISNYRDIPRYRMTIYLAEKTVHTVYYVYTFQRGQINTMYACWKFLFVKLESNSKDKALTLLPPIHNPNKNHKHTHTYK